MTSIVFNEEIYRPVKQGSSSLWFEVDPRVPPKKIDQSYPKSRRETFSNHLSRFRAVLNLFSFNGMCFGAYFGSKTASHPGNSISNAPCWSLLPTQKDMASTRLYSPHKPNLEPNCAVVHQNTCSRKIRIQLHWLLPREKAGGPEEFQNFQILRPDLTPPFPPLILLLQAGFQSKKNF